VLLIDELNELYSMESTLRTAFLATLRRIRDSDGFAIRSVIAAGTFSIWHLNPEEPPSSPFNVADHLTNPNFTEDETLTLFRDFARDRKLDLDDSIAKDVWLKSNGYVSTLTDFLGINFCIAILAWFAFVYV
jgi:hypothetical protein